MQTIRDLEALRAEVGRWKKAGESVGLVPTMGALHPGHLSLVTAARQSCDRVIVTLFVNPKQFNNPEDLDKYPRTEARDRELLAPAGVDLLFAPEVSSIYPQGFLTKVSVAHLPDVLCGSHRPGHFDGVATVVTKLLLMSAADQAFFGEKDWQQLQIIRRLVTDLNIATRVTGCPTLREADGLAMSSRNARLGSAERAIAPALHREMSAAAARITAGVAPGAVLEAASKAILAAGFESVEYLELRGAEDLDLLDDPRPPARLFAAAWLGGVRLIDNIPL
ncbi:MAG: pantoate--beta-alanine ligase [Paracoccaceae bacterium]